MSFKGVFSPGSFFTSRPVLSVMSGGAAAQALQLLAYPVIARLFLPQDLGLFWGGMGGITILVAVFTLQLEAAVLGARPRQVPLLLQVVAWVVGAAAAMSLLLVVLLAALASPKGWPREAWWIVWYMPVGLLAHGLYAIGVARVIRLRVYGRLGLGHLTIALVAVGAQIASGYAGLGVLGLVLSDLLARLFGLWVLWGRPSWVGLPVLRRIRQVLVRFRRFPLLMGPATILNVASQNIQSIFFPLLHGASQAGQLGVATRLTAAPAGLVAGAVSQVFSGELVARQDRPLEQRQLVLETLYLSTMVALPFGFSVAIGADVLIPWGLGESWGLAGVYAAIMSGGVAMSMIVSPISSIVIVRNSLTTAFYFALAEFCIRGLPFVLAMTSAVFSPMLTVVCISAGNIVLYGVGLMRMAKLAEITMVSYLMRIRPLAFASLLCFSPAAAARMLGAGAVSAITFTAAGTLLYLMLALRFRRER